VISISLMTDFVKEHYWVTCEPVCKSKLVAFLINLHEVSLNCPPPPIVIVSVIARGYILITTSQQTHFTTRLNLTGYITSNKWEDDHEWWVHSVTALRVRGGIRAHWYDGGTTHLIKDVGRSYVTRFYFQTIRHRNTWAHLWCEIPYLRVYKPHPDF
jgi:hypothetical protein